jgi:hypothetical protein
VVSVEKRSPCPLPEYPERGREEYPEMTKPVKLSS